MGADGASLPASAADGGLAGLTQAFVTFTESTRRLEQEYAALRRRVAELTSELEEKNRHLAASLARERALEAAALRRSRVTAMGETAAMLAHEVRNPLGAMELFTGLLVEDLREQPGPLRLAREIAAGIADLNHLVTNLLEFTRVRQGAEAGAGRIDCAAVVDEALRYAAHLVAASGIAVVREVPEEPALARGDAALLRPAVLNLIRNAVQAMPAGGRLTVRVARAGGTVTVTVADTGPGIPRAAREAVFTPFFTTRAKGTGLGLTVVRELVAALGGVVEVEDPAEGAALTVRLPAA